MTSSFTRRDFLKVTFVAGGSLLLASCVPALPTEILTPIQTATATSTPLPEVPFQPNLFIRIDPDGMVTLTIHRSEMGQGVRTALAMLLAEELEADWKTIRVQQMDASQGVNQITSGSGSILINYHPLRQAGATARGILVNAAAQFWSIPPEECKAENGEVVRADSGERIGYGKLVGIASDLKLKSTAALKDPREFRFIGTSVPRIDEPEIVTGKAIYGLDVRVPNMSFAVVARSPVVGGKLLTYDASQAEAVTGVRGVVEVPSGVAVVAENTWAAIQGRSALKITWEEGSNARLSSEFIHDSLAAKIKDAIAAEPAAPLKTIEAVYETPYLAHAALEPVNCVADVRSDVCELWMPTQNPQAVQEFVQGRLKLPTIVHVTLLGGGFGRKLEVDYGLEAAEVSKAFGGPVQVVWTREDDIQHDFYRQVTYHWMRAGWESDGTLKLWRHYLAAQGINGIAYQAGVDVLNEDIKIPYTMEGQSTGSFVINFPVHTGPWRGVVSATNAFANESFIDEVATTLRQDPYEFRMSRLSQSDTLRATLQLAAEKAGWGTPMAEGHGRGIACHKTYGQTSVAMVAEVSVADGAVRVEKVTCAINCGQVVHPDMVAQQMEGGIVFGLTTLLNEITYKDGRVQQSNFHDYPLLQMSEMPDVEVHLVQGDSSPVGLGEMGVPPIVPAVTNAIFNATGKRIRHTPIRAGDL